MPRKEKGQRPRHNPLRLPCPFMCCQRKFRNRGGLTKHIRSYHSGQTIASRSRSRSLSRSHSRLSPLLAASIHTNNNGSQVLTEPSNDSDLPDLFAISSPHGSPIQVPNSPICDNNQRLPGQVTLADPSASHPFLNGLHSYSWLIIFYSNLLSRSTLR